MVGAGASGMMAALTAARQGVRVSLLDHNEKCGKKLYITGKGRCNLTNAGTAQDYMDNIPGDGRFLYSALDQLDAAGLMAMVESMGVPLTVERGRRVFPASMKSGDVNRAFERALRASDVKICLGCGVKALLTQDGRILGVMTEDGQRMDADAVILATGGLSYPATGSTGAGHRMAEAAGHTIRPCRPGLVPLETSDTWIPPLAGITLKNVTLSAAKNGRKFFAQQGEMLLTHFGISGPLVLTLSSLLPEGGFEQIGLWVDTKPAIPEEELRERILRKIGENPKQAAPKAFGDLLPVRLLRAVLCVAGIPPETTAGQLTHPQRESLRRTLKALPIHPTGTRGWEEAVITRGGVSLREVDPRTMASKIIEGLYIVGELLDLDAFTGGYNLQIAFSTGFAGGMAAARRGGT